MVGAVQSAMISIAGVRVVDWNWRCMAPKVVLQEHTLRAVALLRGSPWVLA